MLRVSCTNVLIIGGAFNNMIWLPHDAHVVEFNKFPLYEEARNYTGGVAVRMCFLHAYWEMGRSGKYWVVEPSRYHPVDMYESAMEVSVREVAEVFGHIGVLSEQAREAIERTLPEVSHSEWLSLIHI